MTLAYWCVLLAALLPYLWVGLAKSKPGYDNHAPRAQLELAGGWRKRANWAQLNSYEAFPPFAAGVIIAHLTGAPQDRIDLLALAFIGFRLLHGILYVADKASLRTVVWASGQACTAGLFLISAGARG
jgi:uncharacterized MAPEG superfamily protein